MDINAIDNACTITNNAGKPVVVLDAYTSATNIANKSPKKGYEQALKILSPVGGGQSIAPGATGIVTLDDTRTDASGRVWTNYLYQLLLAEPQSLFPVMDVGVALQFTSTPMGYPPVAVTAAAAQNMQRAFAFCQNLMAYPGSQLAKSFAQALIDAEKRSKASDMMQALVQYFNNSTTNFKGLDFPSYLAVSTYLKAFAWTWGLDADGKPGRTYWLYASADAGQQPSGDSATPPHQGAITFTLPPNAPSPADPTDPNSGYEITFQPTSGNAVKLHFNNGQFVDNPSAATPAIGLQGSYALKSTFTHQDSDDVLWPVLVGTLHGTKVLGVSQKPEEAAKKGLTSLLPTSFDGLLGSFMQIMGVVMALDFIKTKLASKEDKLEDDKTNRNEGEEPSTQQEEGADTYADTVGDNLFSSIGSLAKRVGIDVTEVPGVNSLLATMEKVNSDYSKAIGDMTGDFYERMINAYDQQVQTLAEIEVTPDVENAMSQLVEMKENLLKARANGDYSEVKANLSEVKTSINTARENMDNAQDIQQQMEESQAVAKEYEENADNLEEQSKSIGSGEEEFEPELVDF